MNNPSLKNLLFYTIMVTPYQSHVGVQVAEWLAGRSLTSVAWVRFAAGDLIPAL